MKKLVLSMLLSFGAVALFAQSAEVKTETKTKQERVVATKAAVNADVSVAPMAPEKTEAKGGDEKKSCSKSKGKKACCKKEGKDGKKCNKAEAKSCSKDKATADKKACTKGEKKACCAKKKAEASK